MQLRMESWRLLINGEEQQAYGADRLRLLSRFARLLSVIRANSLRSDKRSVTEASANLTDANYANGLPS